MRAFVGYSKELSAENAVSESISRFVHPKLILFFAPTNKFHAVTRIFSEKFQDCNIIGVSSHFSFTDSSVLENALCAISFEDGIDCQCGVINDINRFPSRHKGNLKNALEKIPTENTVCLEFMTAFSFNEDVVMHMLHSTCKKKSIPVAGACASSSLNDLEQYGVAAKSYVSLNGKVYENTCVFAFVHNQNGKIKIISENVFTPTRQSFTVTSVDFEKHKIYTLDDIPAAQALAKAYRCKDEDIPLLLRSYPLGRVTKNGYYMTDIASINDDGSFTMNTAVYNRTKISLFSPMDYRLVTQQTLNQIHDEIPDPSFSFCVCCLERTRFYMQEQYLDEWVKTVCASLKPFIGFASLGEELGNEHFNQIVFGVIFE